MSAIITLSTAGSVDDGKSTLLSRLIIDSQPHLFSKTKKLDPENLVSATELTDGLAAEREQGITIDVGWRHLYLSNCRYLLADAPGHEQYTRNLITAASHAQVLIVLIDPTRLDLTQNNVELLKQTIRHCFIAKLLRIQNLVFVINKLDLFENPKSVYEKVQDSVKQLIEKLKLPQEHIQWIPASALRGDNIVHKSNSMNWYEGPTVLEWLQDINKLNHIHPNNGNNAFGVLPIQTTLRANGSTQNPFRGVVGRVCLGCFSINQEVVILPSKQKATITSIWHQGQQVKQARNNTSITLTLDRDVDISRGDFIVSADQILLNNLSLTNKILCDLVWLISTHGFIGMPLVIKIGTREITARINQFHKIDYFSGSEADKLNEHSDVTLIHLNDIVRVELTLSEPFYFLHTEHSLCVFNRILVMQAQTWTTVAAGVIQIDSDLSI